MSRIYSFLFTQKPLFFLASVDCKPIRNPFAHTLGEETQEFGKNNNNKSKKTYHDKPCDRLQHWLCSIEAYTRCIYPPYNRHYTGKFRYYNSQDSWIPKYHIHKLK